MPKNKINYTTDMAHCRGNNCPLRECCRRFELYVIWEKANLSNLVFFTIEQYDQINKQREEAQQQINKLDKQITDINQYQNRRNAQIAEEREAENPLRNGIAQAVEKLPINTLEQYIARLIALGQRLRMSDQYSNGLSSELGITPGSQEHRELLSILSNTEGMTPEQLAHHITENIEPEYRHLIAGRDAQDIRNTIIDTIHSGITSRKKAYDYIAGATNQLQADEQRYYEQQELQAEIDADTEQAIREYEEFLLSSLTPDDLAIIDDMAGDYWDEILAIQQYEQEAYNSLISPSAYSSSASRSEDRGGGRRPEGLIAEGVVSNSQNIQTYDTTTTTTTPRFTQQAAESRTIQPSTQPSNTTPIRQDSQDTPTIRPATPQTTRNSTTRQDVVEQNNKPTLLDVVHTLYSKGKEVASKLFSMKFFDVATTPKFMQELGLRGDKFTIRYGVIARHLGKDGSHDLSEKDWEQLPQALQNPFAISKLIDKDNSYRIYTTLQTESGEFVVVGVDVKNAGREIEVNAVSTVFGRRNNANLPINEEVIYRSEEITPEQSSLLERPNFAQYPTEQELSESKDTTSSLNNNNLEEKIKLDEEKASTFISNTEKRIKEIVAKLQELLPNEDFSLDYTSEDGTLYKNYFGRFPDSAFKKLRSLWDYRTSKGVEIYSLLKELGDISHWYYLNRAELYNEEYEPLGGEEFALKAINEFKTKATNDNGSLEEKIAQPDKTNNPISYNKETNTWHNVPGKWFTSKPDRFGNITAWGDHNRIQLHYNNGTASIHVIIQDNYAETPARMIDNIETAGFDIQYSGEKLPFVKFQTFDEALAFAQYLDQLEQQIHQSSSDNNTITPNDSYTITPTQYTTKRGNVLNMQLVKFANDLTKEQYRTAKELAKADKGWYDRDKGGFMMRSEESAKQLADTILNNDNAESNAQPVSMTDIQALNDGDIAFTGPVTVSPSASSSASRSEDRGGGRRPEGLNQDNNSAEDRGGSGSQRTPIWQYSIHVDTDGYTVLTREDVSSGIAVGDALFSPAADSPEEMLEILRNPHNNMQEVLDAVGVILENKIKTRQLDRKIAKQRKQEYEALRANGINGYKINEIVIYKGKEAHIHDFEEFGNHRPVLDTGMAPVIYEVAEWSDIKKPQQNQSASSQTGQDLTTGYSIDNDAETSAKVVISNQGAKHELNNIIHKYAGQRKTRGFISDLARALGDRSNEPRQTYYFEFTDKQGNPYTLRISNHNVNGENIADNEKEISIVIKSRRQPNKFIAGNADVREYVYFKESIANGDGQTLAWIAQDIATMLDTGVYEDNSGIAILNISPTNPANQGQFGLVSDDRMAELKERLRRKLGGQMNIGIDPEILSIGLEIAVGHLDRGIKSFTDFARTMIADLGDTIRPYLKAFYNGARELPEVVENGLASDMTPYDEVQRFDVANFDKQGIDAFATAQTVKRETEVADEVKVAKQRIKRSTEKKKSLPSPNTQLNLFDNPDNNNNKDARE